MGRSTSPQEARAQCGKPSSTHRPSPTGRKAHVIAAQSRRVAGAWLGINKRLETAMERGLGEQTVVLGKLHLRNTMQH